MTITRIVTLLSVIALLASLPLTVALAQGQAAVHAWSEMPRWTDESAGSDRRHGRRHGRRRKGRHEGMVGMPTACSRSTFAMGEVGDSMVMFSVMMGEGDDMMEYDGHVRGQDVMIGDKGDVEEGRPNGLLRPGQPARPGGAHQDRRGRNGGHAWPPGPPRQRRRPRRNGTPG